MSEEEELRLEVVQERTDTAAKKPGAVVQLIER